MDSKLLLVQSITLLYKESLLENNSTNSASLVKEVVDSIRLPETAMDAGKGRETLVALRSTALWMAKNPAVHEYEKTELLQRIRVNVGDDESLMQAFSETIEADESDDELKRTILSYRETMRSYLNQSKVTSVLKDASREALFNNDKIDWKNFVREVVERLEPYTSSGDSGRHEAIVDDVDFENALEIQEALDRSKQELTAEGVLKTGFQGLNRMLGTAGGFRRGENVVVGALQHNYKSGMLLSLLKHFCLYNKPYMRDPKKKPMHLRVSFENEVKDDIMWLYVSLKENETGEYCNPREVDTVEAARYVRERLSSNGYHLKMLRVDPSDWTFHDSFDLIMHLEAEGYEIHSFTCDYLNMHSKRGCEQGPTGHEIRDLFRRYRNFLSKRGITFITPHQLSTEAKQLVRNGVDDFVKEIAGKGYYDGCRTIDQEVDLEIYIHIERVGEESYLTVQRGKHRKVEITPLKDLYTVLKFEPVGGIRDDVEGKDLSRRHVGGSAMADGGDKPWFTN